MSKALPVTVAVILGGVALVPIYFSSQKAAEAQTTAAVVSDASKPATAASASTTSNSTIAKVSYMLGYELGASQQVPPNIDGSALSNGIKDASNGKEPKYSEAELQAAFTEYKAQLLQEMEREAKISGAEGAKFLAENAKKPDVKTTATGLQYKITNPGTGKQPKADSMVTVHYKGQLISGKVFDSSYKKNQPIDFKLNEVIPGWTEGLQLLKEGGKATLYVPAKLAYGERSVPGIPANSTLIFDVELIKVK
ncbi:FKBP-type peptidyl-prolyl cis-trans isomerase [Acinetobacter larvae]|uniref:Peptidyl-prolyl cis-trans isomerase n=1 Tax=Acinetobacter larvae TaxID=1789224 RepID=A0A1B2LVP1_9GAMM|nr:FKBP-type peptidyl-prolyl cis-trans isomerase [Acinetobacter larvae]AOA56985.1 peptidylprolyl isomerase [Acinetobacter larvae]